MLFYAVEVSYRNINTKLVNILKDVLKNTTNTYRTVSSVATQVLAKYMPLNISAQNESKRFSDFETEKR